MLLVIDAGNTNIVFAVHDGKDVRAEWRAVTETTRTADEYAVLLSPLLALNGLTFDDLDSAIIATVVPAALFDLRLLCRRYLKCEPLVVGDPNLDLGIEIHIDRPEAVGADRLVNTVAAHERYKGALIVVSDGGDNASKHTLAEIMALAGQPNAIIYTIGIFDDEDPDRNPKVLKRLAKQTGGEAFFPESLADVTPTCELIARDIRSQYTIAYVPTNRKRDGTYRVIQVKASAPGHGRLAVRTRTGYFAPSALPPAAAKVIDHATHN